MRGNLAGMATRNLMMALLITLAVGAGLALRRYENSLNAKLVRQLSEQLEQTKTDLAYATAQLLHASKKLGFVQSARVRVQVTAYALTDEFGSDPMFASNAPARVAYAVPKHTLPTGRILNVALSPTVERELHANLNDTIVLVSRNRSRQYLARFVDRTLQTETRPVVDILFANPYEANIWGRQSFFAIDISRLGSPFQH